MGKHPTKAEGNVCGQTGKRDETKADLNRRIMILEKEVEMIKGILAELVFSKIDRAPFIEESFIEKEKKLSDECWRNKEKRPQLDSLRKEIEEAARKHFNLLSSDETNIFFSASLEKLIHLKEL